MDDEKTPIGELKRRWGMRDTKAMIEIANRAVVHRPQDFAVQKYRLRAALAEQIWAVVADSALALAAANPQLAFTAAQRLAKAGDLESAMHIFLQLRDDGGAEIAGFEEAADQIALSLLKIGSQANAEGDQATARLYWQAGAQIAPKNMVLREKLLVFLADALAAARAANSESNPAKYIAAWEEVQSLDPRNSAVARKLAVAWDRMGDVANGFEGWLRAVKLEPADTVALGRFVRAARRADREDEAIAALRKLGRDEASDPYIDELRESQRIKSKSLRPTDYKAASEGMRACISTLEKAPHDSVALDRLMQLARLFDMEAEASAALRRLGRTNADDPFIAKLRESQREKLRKLAVAAEKSNSASDSVRSWLRMLELEPADPLTLGRLVRDSRRADLEDEAIAALHKLGHEDAADPYLAQLRESLRGKMKKRAVAAEKSDDASDSMRYWLRVLMIEPNDRVALGRMMRASQKANLEGEAFIALRMLGIDENADPRLAKLRESGQKKYRKLALAADKLANATDSIEYWTRVLEVEPANALAPVRLKRAALRGGLEYKALMALSARGLDDPNDLGVSRLRKRILKECRRALSAGDAVGAFERLSLLTKGPHEDDADLKSLRAVVVRKLAQQVKLARKAKEVVKATDLAERILTLDPGHAFALAVVAEHFLKLQRYDDATKLCERLLDIDPADPKARSLLERVTGQKAAEPARQAVPV